MVPFFVGFAAGWSFYLVLMQLWGTRLFVLPGSSGWRDERRRQTAAMVSLFRPAFIGRVFTATGWPPTQRSAGRLHRPVSSAVDVRV
jgi:hypothetical protein